MKALKLFRKTRLFATAAGVTVLFAAAAESISAHAVSRRKSTIADNAGISPACHIKNG